MSSNIAIDDAELKSRLAHFGILTPITNTTKKVLLKKLHHLEINSIKKETNLGSSQCSSSGSELMVSRNCNTCTYLPMLLKNNNITIFGGPNIL